MKSVWISSFFTRQAIAKIHFVLQSTYAGYTPCPVWLDLDISLTRSKRPIFKICYSRNSQISEFANFANNRTLSERLFLLHSTYTGDTPFRVWSNLNNFLTQWKRTIFKIPYSRNSKISVWKPYELVTFN